jgi:hypothetical protein
VLIGVLFCAGDSIVQLTAAPATGCFALFGVALGTFRRLAFCWTASGTPITQRFLVHPFCGPIAEDRATQPVWPCHMCACEAIASSHKTLHGWRYCQIVVVLTPQSSTCAAAAEAPPMPAFPAIPAPAAPAGSVAPGVNGGPLGGFMQQPMQQQPMQQLGVQQQQQQEQPAPPSGLAALLSNPAMLSAAILGGAAAAAPSSSAAMPGTVLAGPAHGMQLQLNSNMAGGLDDGSMFGGFGQMPGTFSAGFGMMPAGMQGQGGFADEGDDPYDPTLEG